MGRWLRGAIGSVLIFVITATPPIAAAASFANPAFDTQWREGEAIAANFWGPLANARSGEQEAYKEAPGGERLVQYFDKGRMELTNGVVTNGLLAKEMITGQHQIGDNTFQAWSPAAVPMAGDPDNPSPTYAQLSKAGAPLLAPTTAQIGTAPTRSLTAAGFGNAATGGTNDPNETLSVFDQPTSHNVAAIFAQYRMKVGLASIGYAISEPFLSSVKVGGVPKDVLIQAFERRVLTYTAANPAAFQVEMGNVGQHFAMWKSAGGAAGAAITQGYTVTAPPTPIPTPAPQAGSSTSFPAVSFVSVHGARPSGTAAATIHAPPNSICTLAYTPPEGDASVTTSIGPKTATAAGVITWTWLIPSFTKTGTGTLSVSCLGGLSLAAPITAPIPIG